MFHLHFMLEYCHLVEDVQVTSKKEGKGSEGNILKEMCKKYEDWSIALLDFNDYLKNINNRMCFKYKI